MLLGISRQQRFIFFCPVISQVNPHRLDHSDFISAFAHILRSKDSVTVNLPSFLTEKKRAGSSCYRLQKKWQWSTTTTTTKEPLMRTVSFFITDGRLPSQTGKRHLLQNNCYFIYHKMKHHRVEKTSHQLFYWVSSFIGYSKKGKNARQILFSTATLNCC